MTLNEYQAAARKFAAYPEKDKNIVYPALKLAGEAGEFADKVGKYWRNSGVPPYELLDSLTEEQRAALVRELGDVQWYIADLATVLGITLDELARINIRKLKDRQNRGVLLSEGEFK